MERKERSLRNIWDAISDVLPAWFLPGVMFLFLPVTLYLANRHELIGTVIFPFIAAFVISCILLSLLLFAKSSIRLTVSFFLFYIGLYILLADMLAPVQLGPLEGEPGQQTPGEPLVLTAVELLIALGVIALAIKLPARRLKGFISVFVLAALVAQAGMGVVEFRSSFRQVLRDVISGRMFANEEALAPPSVQASNIYHFIFDAYSNLTFLRSATELGILDDFDGFTFFPNNRANYVYTTLSIPSFMTGTLYEGGSIVQWIRAWREESEKGVVSELHRKDYVVSMYAYTRSYCHNRIPVRCVDAREVGEELYFPRMVLHFADLWALRVLPNFLQQEAYHGGRGLFSRSFVGEAAGRLPLGEDMRPYAAVETIRRMIEDEKARPAHGQYVHGYFYVPHGPYILNRNCEYSPDLGTLFNETESYYEQASCVTRLMAEFISELKRLGRYHDATIIFQSDTGKWGICPDEEGFTMTNELSESIRAMNVREASGRGIDCQTRALLLVKPGSRSGTSLVVSERETQLADVAATVYDLASISADSNLGISVFAENFPTSREVHIYLGYKQKDKNGKWIILGRDIEEGDINHLSYRKGKGWKIYPNLRGYK